MKKLFLLSACLVACSHDLGSPGQSDRDQRGLHGEVKTLNDCIVGGACLKSEFLKNGFLKDMPEKIFISKKDDIELYESKIGDSRWVYRYSKGKIISETIYNKEDGSEIATGENTYEYNDDGKKIRYTMDMGFARAETQYQYAADGNLKYSYFSGPVHTQEALYDSKGLMIESLTTSKDGKKIDFYKYELDSKGNWIKQYKNDKLYITRDFVYY